MNKTSFIASLLLRVIVFVLIALTPIAISFKPYYLPEKPGYPAVYEDPQYLLKAFFIAIGLIGGILAVISSSLYLVNTRPHQKSQLVLHLSMTICAVALGWHIFPYSVNGLFQMLLGNVDYGDFSPRRLLPTIWVGEIWLNIAVLLYPILMAGSLILILITISMVLRRNLTKWQALKISMFLILTVLTFALLPKFVEWVAD